MSAFAAFRGSVTAAREELARLPGVVSVEVVEDGLETRARLECEAKGDPREEIFHLAVSKGWILRELALDVGSLEDVFVRLTRHEEPTALARQEEPAAQPVEPATEPGPEEPEAS